MGFELLAIESEDLNKVFPSNSKKLYAYLEVDAKYADWIANRIEQYGFIEGEDYEIETIKTRGRPRKEYHITLDMAKELSMVESNDRGRQARRYFIQMEKEYRNTIPPTQLDLITPYEIRRDLSTARRLLTIEKKKHRQTAEYFELEIAKLKSKPYDVFMNDSVLHNSFLEFLYQANRATHEVNAIRHLSPALDTTHQSLSNFMLHITRRYEKIRGVDRYKFNQIECK